MNLQTVAVRAGEEEFVAYSMDSDLGRALLLNMADHFIARVRDKVNPQDWSHLALEAATGAGVVKVVLDTMSDNPAARVRGEGSVTEGLVPTLARAMWENRRQELLEAGHHAPLSCTDGNQKGSGCPACHRGGAEWVQLPPERHQELEQLAKAALVTLNELRLLP